MKQYPKIPLKKGLIFLKILTIISIGFFIFFLNPYQKPGLASEKKVNVEGRINIGEDTGITKFKYSLYLTYSFYINKSDIPLKIEIKPTDKVRGYGDSPIKIENWPECLQWTEGEFNWDTQTYYIYINERSDEKCNFTNTVSLKATFNGYLEKKLTIREWLDKKAEIKLPKFFLNNQLINIGSVTIKVGSTWGTYGDHVNLIGGNPGVWKLDKNDCINGCLIGSIENFSYESPITIFFRSISPVTNLILIFFFGLLFFIVSIFYAKRIQPREKINKKLIIILFLLIFIIPAIAIYVKNSPDKFFNIICAPVMLVIILFFSPLSEDGLLIINLLIMFSIWLWTSLIFYVFLRKLYPKSYIRIIILSFVWIIAEMIVSVAILNGILY